MPRIKQAYTWYCSRQAAAHTKLVQLLTDARHATYFAESWELARPHTNAWDLPSLLIKPVQRVLKYPLLLDDLLRCTPETHPDHGNIQDAATAIKAVADEINEVKRRKETVDRVFQPAGSLSDPTSPAPNSHHHPASTTSSKGGKMASKLGGLLGKDRDKDKDRDFRAANAAASQAALQFNQKSHDELRATEKSYAALVTRLMAAEQTARQLGKLVAGAGTRAREPWAAQRRAVEVWRRIVNLDGLEPVEDIRIEAYRSVVLEILARPCKAMVNSLLHFFSSHLVLSLTSSRHLTHHRRTSFATSSCPPSSTSLPSARAPGPSSSSATLNMRTTTASSSPNSEAILPVSRARQTPSTVLRRSWRFITSFFSSSRRCWMGSRQCWVISSARLPRCRRSSMARFARCLASFGSSIRRSSWILRTKRERKKEEGRTTRREDMRGRLRSVK